MSAGKEKKIAYIEKLVSLFEAHTKILLVTSDNIGAHHMSKVRKALRGTATMLLGKNTMMRKAIRGNLDSNPQWAAVLPELVGNVGLVFTNQDLGKVSDILLSMRVPAAAKVGMVAPQDVVVPKGQTSMEPTKTSFLQALNIASKINKGTVEILNDVELVKKGEKVGPSQAQLLQFLDIRPFTYGLEVVSVYDNGSVYDASVLSITEADVIKGFGQGVSEVAALSLALGLPSLAAFPHVVINGYKNLLAVVAATDYVFKQAEKLKEMLENPDAFRAAAPVAAAPVAAAKEEPKKEEKPESEDMGFDLFG